MRLYPPATYLPSLVQNPVRSETRGVVIHETYGHPAGDIPILRAEGAPGNRVDVQFYVQADGRVFQFLDADRGCWGAMQTANDTCVQIEHEGDGSPWPFAQIHASARLVAWLSVQYGIPLRHTQPRPGVVASFHGIFGHKDLTTGGVDGNTHTDTLPSNLTWDAYLNLCAAYLAAVGGPTPVTVYGFDVNGGAVNLPGKWRFKLFAEHHRDQLGNLGAHAWTHKIGGIWYVAVGPRVQSYGVKAARDHDALTVTKMTGRTTTPFTRQLIK